ncbi:phenazine biosynthesis protein PhzF, partial [Kocuria tytonicola]|uniref:PhzF family phenazine biosynthesis protein n=1 Tax=Kocuria tytonicola TaxID=2055946 RepID=UPI000F266833
PTLRSGDLAPEVLEAVTTALGLRPEQVLAHQWVDDGPGWAAVLLGSAEEVLAVEPDLTALNGHKVGVVGPAPEGAEHHYEVRAFVSGTPGCEDPVTGSLNAGLAQWLLRTGRAPQTYTARQGTRMGRRGMVHVSTDTTGTVRVGGSCTVCVTGSVTL